MTLGDRQLRLTANRPVRVEGLSSDAGGVKPSADGLKGAPETETRIVLMMLPEKFTWREVYGMCSVFGQVQSVWMEKKAKGEEAEAAAATEGAESSSSDESSKGQKQKLPRVAVATMVDRRSAETAIANLHRLTVDGSRLRVRIYKAEETPAD